jgi:ketosteroid isomerase-like protein
VGDSSIRLPLSQYPFTQEKKMSDKDTIAHIEALDAKRANFILARDFAGLDPLISEDLRYVHSSAVMENKQQYLAKLSSGHYIYRALTTLQREMRVVGDVVLVNGDARIEVEVGGTAKVVMSRYLQVWVKGSAGWQMASWQSTPIPQK